MPSITTQNIATAAAKTVPTPASVTQQLRNAVATPQQISVAGQMAADKVTLTPRRSDKERAPQNPKKVEGAFASQSSTSTYSKKSGKPVAQEPDEGEDQSGIDLTA